MTFIEDGKLSPDIARWIAPVVSIAVLFGGLITIWTGLQSQGAVQDERIRSLEGRMSVSAVDHDMVLQINVRLAAMELAQQNHERDDWREVREMRERLEKGSPKP